MKNGNGKTAQVIFMSRHDDLLTDTQKFEALIQVATILQCALVKPVDLTGHSEAVQATLDTLKGWIQEMRLQGVFQ